jgi:hypothetical protein
LLKELISTDFSIELSASLSAKWIYINIPKLNQIRNDLKISLLKSEENILSPLFQLQEMGASVGVSVAAALRLVLNGDVLM